jgi:hypothetical protein
MIPERKEDFKRCLFHRLTSQRVAESSETKNCRVSIISLLMRSWISEIPLRRSDAFIPDLGRFDMTLSRTRLNARAESALVTTIVDSFVGFKKKGIK